jgi:GNAT superfamily N-acetyltransferase
MTLDPATAFECDWNYWRANAAFFGTSRIGAVAETYDLILQHCGAPQTEFNTAFLKHPGHNLEQGIAAAQQYFAGFDLPFSFECRSQQAELCSDALEAAGFHRTRETPAMVLEPIHATRDSIAGLEIEQVEAGRPLEEFQAAAFRGFGMPEQAGALFLTEQLHATPGVIFYLGRLDGIPVCTSMLVRTGKVAGIYWVATVEAHRGKGLGEAITAAAAEAGAEAGCRVASLQASQAGQPVYRRMGFDVHGHYVKFEPPPAAGHEQ